MNRLVFKMVRRLSYVALCLATICPSFLCGQEPSITNAAENEAFMEESFTQDPRLDVLPACPRCRRAKSPGPLRRPLPPGERMKNSFEIV